MDEVSSTHQPIVADGPQSEVAFVESGALRSAGWIARTPEAFELFAQSLAPTDRVAASLLAAVGDIRRSRRHAG